MKILDTENWERLSGGVERFVASDITDKEQGAVMVEALNQKYSGSTRQHTRYYKLVDDNYELREGYVRDF